MDKSNNKSNHLLIKTNKAKQIREALKIEMKKRVDREILLIKQRRMKQQFKP